MPAKHWTYSGEEGPEHWAELDPAFQTCGAGQEQSPINFDLDLMAPIIQMPSIGWSLEDSPVRVSASSGLFVFICVYKVCVHTYVCIYTQSYYITHTQTDRHTRMFMYIGNTGESEDAGKEFYNGHTFEVEDLGKATIVFDGITYTLVQFHTHTPSEHHVAGRHYDMEMHFVHKAVVDGVTKLAVVGCFYEKGDRSPTVVQRCTEMYRMCSLYIECVLAMGWPSLPLFSCGVLL